VADYGRREKESRAFLERLEAIDRSRLADAERLNYDLFRRSLRDRIGEYEFKTYLLPITNREGFHTEFPQLADNVPLDDARDYENYCARLEAFATYANQHIELMRAGLKGGYTLPRVVMEGWEGVSWPRSSRTRRRICSTHRSRSSPTPFPDPSARASRNGDAKPS